MATLTANSSMPATDLTYRGSLRDLPYTGSVVIRSLAPDCDGSIILYWENGKLLGQFWSTTRTLDLISDVSKLVYSADKTIVIQDPTPIQIKPGSYYARFYPGSSAYYAHAAVRSSCGCGWCPEPCDRIWTVSGGSIQSIHESEKRLPEYGKWIPMAYHLGVYGDKSLTSKPVRMPLDSISTISGGGISVADTGYTSTPKDLEFLDIGAIDFCTEVSCDSPAIEKGDIAGPKKCTTCGGQISTNKKPQSGDCGCK